MNKIITYLLATLFSIGLYSCNQNERISKDAVKNFYEQEKETRITPNMKHIVDYKFTDSSFVLYGVAQEEEVPGYHTSWDSRKIIIFDKSGKIYAGVDVTGNGEIEKARPDNLFHIINNEYKKMHEKEQEWKTHGE